LPPSVRMDRRLLINSRRSPCPFGRNPVMSIAMTETGDIIVELRTALPNLREQWPIPGQGRRGT